MDRGHALYTLGPKRKGPLKRIVCCMSGDHDTNLFGVNFVLLECGHRAKSYGGERAICQKCKNGEPKDSMVDFGFEDPLKVPIAEHYQKNFTPEELKARNEGASH